MKSRTRPYGNICTTPNCTAHLTPPHDSPKITLCVCSGSCHHGCVVIAAIGEHLDYECTNAAAAHRWIMATTSVSSSAMWKHIFHPPTTSATPLLSAKSNASLWERRGSNGKCTKFLVHLQQRAFNLPPILLILTMLFAMWRFFVTADSTACSDSIEK
jgi:hypothetical protein